MDEAAPRMTEAEQEAYIARCPESSHWAVRGWLKGTHDLDGTVKPLVGVGS